MCKKYRAFTGSASMAIKKDGGYPTNIFNGDFSVDIKEPRELERALDSLESGIMEGENPVFIVTHYEEKPSNKTSVRP